MVGGGYRKPLNLTPAEEARWPFRLTTKADYSTMHELTMVAMYRFLEEMAFFLIEWCEWPQVTFKFEHVGGEYTVAELRRQFGVAEGDRSIDNEYGSREWKGDTLVIKKYPSNRRLYKLRPRKRW